MAKILISDLDLRDEKAVLNSNEISGIIGGAIVCAICNTDTGKCVQVKCETKCA